MTTSSRSLTLRHLFFLLFLIPLTVSAQEIKLMSWNVYMIPKPIRFSKQGTRTTLIKLQLSKLDHDVIILQEAFSWVFRHRVGKALESTYPHQSLLKRGGFRALNSGVFVLSRYPFKVLEKLNYDECSEMDCYAGKGVILIELQHPSGKKLQIATSHIQAEHTPEAKAARNSQFILISELLARHRTEGIPQVLAGDLNINAFKLEESSEFNMALRTLKMSNGPLTGDYKYTASYKVDCYQNDNGNSKSWLDHVLISENGSGARVENRNALPFFGTIKGKVCPLSDHFGIEALIKF